MENKISLVVAAHGSRSPVAVAEVELLSGQLAKKLTSYYRACRPAFLEMASPTIHECVDNLIEDGAEEVHVLPYFLTSGVHVTADIPRHMCSIAEEFPDVKLKLLPAVGLAPQMMSALESMVIDQFAVT